MFCVHAQPPVVSLISNRAEVPSCSYSSSSSRRSLKRTCRCGSLSSIRRELNTLSFLHQNLNLHQGCQSRRFRVQVEESGGIAEQIDPNDTRKEVYEAAATNILEEYEDKQDLVSTSNGSSSTQSVTGEASTQSGASMDISTKGRSKETKSKEQEVDWEKVSTMPDELELAQRHPLDPHKPNFSHQLPEPLRPYPSFEGWMIRLADPKAGFSAGLIMATNYATDESQVTLLIAPGKDSDHNKNGALKADGDRDSMKHGFTYAMAIKTKDAKFTIKEHSEKLEGNQGTEPEGFEWEANGIGRISVTPHTTDFDFTVEGYTFKGRLTKEILWDAHNSEKGPEGWARYVTIIPTHWYVYSLGSTAEYSFSNPEKGIHTEGTGYGHMEKNWGQTFPAGHVWLQAFSSDNTAQICSSGAYFKSPNEKLSSPYLFVLAYRSPKLQLDYRSNDWGIFFKDIHFEPLESKFSMLAVGPSHTVEVTAYAPYNTFSDNIYAPVSKVDWEPACCESYVATAEIKVYEHLAWGIPGTENLVETQKFELAALEFGEDLLEEASQNSGKEL